MGRFLDDGNYVSDNNVVYEIFEGVTLDRSKRSDVIYIMLEYNEDLYDKCNIFGDDEFVHWFRGASCLTDPQYKEEYIKHIETYCKEYEHNHKDVVEFYNKPKMNDELKEMLGKFIVLTQCGGIRSYYDEDTPSKYDYRDSHTIHNFFSICEEIGIALEDEDIDKAEEMIYGLSCNV